ncbi:polyprenyl diphosphate synthase [Methanosalsum zhilinae]|nr:polyprenyl diphosphate synthase [Methanosalsum zhilinae]
MINRIIKFLYQGYEKILFQEVSKGPLPAHIAIIMDGNRRFASKIGKNSYFGHSKGARVTENLIRWSWEIGIKQLTIYAFSAQNFKRSPKEINDIFDLMSRKFDRMSEDEEIHENRVKVKIIGDKNRIPPFLQRSIDRLETNTHNYDQFNLNIAIAYGGRQDIVQATQEIATKIKNKDLSVDQVTEMTISEHLYPADDAAVPNVDLIIRTGGDERISNFLPWQTNGNECAAYFCAPYWPEFKKIDFLRSIRVYQARKIEVRKNNALRTAQLLASIGNKRSFNAKSNQTDLSISDCHKNY